MKKSIAKMLIIAFSVGSCVGCGQNQTESVSETNTAMVQDDIVILYTSDVLMRILDMQVWFLTKNGLKKKHLM